MSSSPSIPPFPLPLQPISRRQIFVCWLGVSLWAGVLGLVLHRLAPRLLGWVWGPLPRFTLDLQAGDSCSRCADPADHPPPTPGQLLTVRLDAPLDIRLRPERPAAGLLSVHAFLSHDGRLHRWPILMESAAQGSMQLRGLCRDVLNLSPSELGTYELIFVLQRSPLLPSYAEAQDRLMRAPHDPATQIIRRTIEVVAP